MQSTQIELLGRHWLATQLLHAGIDLAQPDRDAGVDLIAYPTDFSWFCPIQLKTASVNGVTMWEKYVGKPLAVVYVLLGAADGGPATRPETRAYALPPADAWDLPRRCGRTYDPVNHGTYRFPAVTARLQQELQLYAVTTDLWVQRLRTLSSLGR